MLQRSHSRHASTVAIAVLAAALVGGGWSTAASGSSSGTAQAKKYLLTLSDMPHGWKTEKGTGGSSGSNGAFPGASQLAGCIGVSPAIIGASPPEEDSPYFENSSGSLEVQDSVSTFSSAKTAKAQLAAIGNAKTPGCMASLLNGSYKSKIAASAGSGATVGTISVVRLPQSVLPNGTNGLRLTIPVTDGGTTLTVVVAFIYFVKGKLGQQVTLNSYGVAFPTSLGQSLINVAIHRL